MKLNTSPLLIDFLRHIQSELDFIGQTASDMNADTLLSDPTKSRVVMPSLLVVGEACKRVPDEFRTKHPGFDWRGSAGMRDRLIHHYWGVDQELFWETVSVDVPANKEWIDVIIEQEASAS